MENEKNQEMDQLDAQAWTVFYLARSARERASQLSIQADNERLIADALSRRAKQLWREIREKEGAHA